MEYSLEGQWSVDIGDGVAYDATLPGTLDENRIGHPDAVAKAWHPEAGLGDSVIDTSGAIATRFTRIVTFEGAARFTRRVHLTPHPGRRQVLEIERTRHLRVLIDGREVLPVRPTSVSTPHVFDVTGMLTGDNEITLICDNSYPGWPHDGIVFSSAATDETQTNWNGILGYLRVREVDPVAISSVRVYPSSAQLTVVVEVDAAEPYEGELVVRSDALREPARAHVSLHAGEVRDVVLEGLDLVAGVATWDEFDPHLHDLSAALDSGATATARFGVRTFGDDGTGRFALNGRRLFLRSEANCAVFPETGYSPMSVEEWTRVLRVFASYGVNIMRFHSHTPPIAAFEAADRLGMLMQPELSHWNPVNAFEPEDAWEYYRAELRETLRVLANHPSFVMLTFGNELVTGDLGHARMSEMLAEARAIDPTRCYANGSNVHYGLRGADPDSDFYTTQSFVPPERAAAAASPGQQMSAMAASAIDYPIRGTFASIDPTVSDGIMGYINNDYPSAAHTYDASVAKIRESFDKPVYSFEVGQFEVLPDFDELEAFQGISDPANLRIVRDRVEALGLLPRWKEYVEATGEIARLAYREEIEAAMRTEGLSGISLLGLQDFPGQGTALVGMLDSHLHPKPFPFADPAAFADFFTDRLPLVLLPRYTFEHGETLVAPVRIANYGKEAVDAAVHYTLRGEGVDLSGDLAPCSAPSGALTDAGTLTIALPSPGAAVRLRLEVSFGPLSTSYPVWLYPAVEPRVPASVHETTVLDAAAEAVLARGGVVFLAPPATAEALGSSIKTQFTTDFWSVGTFPAQAGGMGQLIDADHPIFEGFPTEAHSNWQWWPMAVQRAVVLPEPIESIVTEMDSYAFLRPMTKLFECRVGGGRLLFSSLGLQDLQQHPEARALLSSIYSHLDSDAFAPTQELDIELIRSLVR